jgi:lipopolysaccharide transport protein LptA
MAGEGSEVAEIARQVAQATQPSAGAEPETARTASRPATGTLPRPGGVLSTDSDQPLSINAEELEAIELPNGSRQLLFNRSVHVEQGELSVHSNRLEAHYAAGASQPERLVANGQVRVSQRERGTGRLRELSCNAATYFPASERLECVGNAELRDGDNRVRGERIEIRFQEDRIRVTGGAVVNVAPERKPAKDAAPSPAVGAAPAGGGP